MRIVAACLTAFVLFAPAAAEADSDGYFCVGRGYLAYETRFSTMPGKHELHVVRFGGIVAAPPVPLDDFQVHGMVCGSGTVELLAFSTAYTVDLSDPNRLQPSSRPAAFQAGQVAPAENLGHWGKAQVIDLEAEGPDAFQLVIARVSQRLARGVEHHVVSRLIQRGSTGARAGGIVASLKVFEGVFLETAD